MASRRISIFQIGCGKINYLFSISAQYGDPPATAVKLHEVRDPQAASRNAKAIQTTIKLFVIRFMELRLPYIQ